MITLKNTKNLLGVTLAGDLDDLKELYEAISHLNDLYCSQQRHSIDLAAEQGILNQSQVQNARSGIQSRENCVLGLMYDIRHAYQGDRNFEYKENGAQNLGVLGSLIFAVDKEKLDAERSKGKNGNLYYKVDILYPWALYYLVALNSIYSGSYYEEQEFNYNEILYRKDEAIVQLLIAELLQCLAEVMGDKKALRYQSFMEMADSDPELSSLYCTVLCTYMADEKHNSKPLRKHMILITAYEMVGTDNLHDKDLAGLVDLKGCRDDWSKAKAAVRRSLGEDFLSEDLVYSELDEITGGKNTYNNNDLDKLEQKFGTVDWDRLIW